MSWADCALLALVIAWVVGSAVWMRRRKKRGKCIGCAGDCASCPYTEHPHDRNL